MKICFFSLVAFVLTVNQVIGQEIDTTEYRRKKVKIIAGFDTRQTFVSGFQKPIYGIRIGVDLQRGYRFGVGYYMLGGGKEEYLSTGNVEDTSLPARKVKLRFSYFGAFYEQVWLKRGRWELFTPFVLGVGRSNINLFDKSGTVNYGEKPSALYIGEVSAQAQYSIFQWLVLGSGVGYRQVLAADKYIHKDLSSPIWILRLKVFPLEFIDIYKGKQKLFE